MEIPKKEREVFEDQIIADGFVEFSGYSLKKDEFEGYVDERVECAWFAYKQAFRRATEKAQVVPESNALLSASLDAIQKLGSGDFVLVPKKPDVDKAWNIALKRIVPPPKTNDVVQKELMCKKYVDDLCFEQDRILLNYEEMIEAQEQSHEHS